MSFKSSGLRAFEFMNIGLFRKRLLSWYRRHKRVLPWRSDPTPYRVWVSEIMLQQTQMRTVLPFYERFLVRFPNVQSLAAAHVDEVVEAWAGLGYYSRARNIHEAARKIAGASGGRFPATLDGWLELPGIGKYTAGAILSIAFNQPHPVVDGNVRRVITRIHAPRKPPGERFFWEQASAWVPRDRPSEFNQALMELGALVCTPSSPDCEFCPARSLCEARRLGIQEEIPRARTVRKAESVELVLLVIRRQGSVLVSNETLTQYIPGPCHLPGSILRAGEVPEEAARDLARRLNLPGIPLTYAGHARHSITYRRILAHVFSVRLGRRLVPERCSGLRWADSAEASRLLTSSLFRKAIATIA